MQTVWSKDFIEEPIPNPLKVIKINSRAECKYIKLSIIKNNKDGQRVLSVAEIQAFELNEKTINHDKSLSSQIFN